MKKHLWAALERLKNDNYLCPGFVTEDLGEILKDWRNYGGGGLSENKAAQLRLELAMYVSAPLAVLKGNLFNVEIDELRGYAALDMIQAAIEETSKKLDGYIEALAIAGRDFADYTPFN